MIEPLIYATFAQPVQVVGFTNLGPAVDLKFFDALGNVIATTGNNPSTGFLGMVTKMPVYAFSVAGLTTPVIDDFVFTEIAPFPCGS